MTDKPHVSLQENLVTLVCFYPEQGRMVRHSVPLSYFESSLKDVAERAYSFIDQYDDVPRDHIADLLEDELESEDSDLYEQILDGIYQLKDSLNVEYTMNSLRKFNRKQKLRMGLVEAGELVQSDDSEETLDKAEAILNDSLKGEIDLFDKGYSLLDFGAVLEVDDSDAFPTGISELDEPGLGPQRKELNVLIAPPKKGKTWWLTNLGKRATVEGSTVVHVSLEMSSRKMLKRYLQSYFSISNRPATHQVPIIEKDDLGRMVSIDYKDLDDRPSFQDPDIGDFLEKKVNRFRAKNRLIIKEFPTRSLTINGLKAYLDSLENIYGIVPDLLIVDYVDIMRIDPDNYRLQLKTMTEDMRGIAVERNMAIATVTQSNREGAKSKVVDDTNVAEDWSKIMTADTILTYSQTQAEKELNLGRIFVADGRNEADKFMVLIAQNYGIGQFAIDSSRMSSGSYWREVNELSMEDDEE